jgi:hypothetical protein
LSIGSHLPYPTHALALCIYNPPASSRLFLYVADKAVVSKISAKMLICEMSKDETVGLAALLCQRWEERKKSDEHGLALYMLLPHEVP